ncbi:hypothetical protein FACS189434_03340 [Bacteroidia bacterium]|nr:hypothetical protein FACS189434_03340 [Bacteroidia bacterium]
MKKLIILMLEMIFVISSISQNYASGTKLLEDDARGGEVQWGQRYNNKYNYTNTCYNKYCPSGSYGGHTLAGCGAVAMGQIMWKWQYPQSSSYRTYNWSLMPNVLNDTIIAVAQGDEVAHFIRDCGNAVNMHYWESSTDIHFIDEALTGSWCTIGNVESALKYTFSYQAAITYSKSDWFNSAWEELIRSEIRAGRPVFYEGKKNLFSGHFFVIDGYDTSDPSLFHINWGWVGSYNGYYRLNDLTPGNDHNYNSYQKLIVGISPTYPQASNVNIYDVSYTTVSNTKTETARQNIVLPANNKTLTVSNGGNYTLVAGNSITLKPGFKVLAGSNFNAKIEPIYTIDKEIRVPVWYTAFTPFTIDGYNDVYCIDSENADTWAVEVRNMDDYVIYQAAGNIEPGSPAFVWDGSNSNGPGAYRIDVRLTNSYGRYLAHSMVIEAVSIRRNAPSSNIDVCSDINTLIFKDKEGISIMENNDLSTDIKSNNIPKLTISPNPTTGKVYVLANNEKVTRIEVKNIQGATVLSSENIPQNEILLDISAQAAGMYFISVQTENGVKTFKVVKN